MLRKDPNTMTPTELAEAAQYMATNNESPNSWDAETLRVIARRLQVCHRCGWCGMQIRHEAKARTDGCQFHIGDRFCGLEEHLHPALIDGVSHVFWPPIHDHPATTA